MDGKIGLNAERAPPPERGDGESEGRGIDVGETRRKVATGRGGTPETSICDCCSNGNSDRETGAIQLSTGWKTLGGLASIRCIQGRLYCSFSLLPLQQSAGRGRSKIPFYKLGPH